MRAQNMQALTNDIKARYPGVTVYGVGDKEHALRVSDHNEDDTAGVRAAQTDADTVPEHRAIDVMLGSAFNRTQASALIQEILAQPRLRARLWYINFENSQWSRSNGWVKRDNSDDPHPSHIHFSGWASADEDSSPWLTGNGGDMQARLGDNTAEVGRLQEKLLFLRPDAATSAHPLTIDQRYGANTAWWVSVILTGGPGDNVTPAWFDKLNDMVLDKKLATVTAGPAGPQGPEGPPGKTPTQVTFGPVTATVTSSE